MPIVNNELSFGLAGAQGGIIGAKGAPLVAAATITVTDSFHEVSGAGVITTINCDALAPNSLLFLRPAAGSTWSLGTGGNITANVVITVGETVALEWDGTNVHPQGMMAGNAITRTGGLQPLMADLDLGAKKARSRNSVDVINANAYPFLASGGGTGDQSTAINNAILEAAQFTNPPTVVLEAGAYRCTNPLNMLSMRSIRLRGTQHANSGGNGRTSIFYDNGNTHPRFIDARNTDSIYLDGLLIYSNVAFAGTLVDASGLSFTDISSNFHMSHCNIGSNFDDSDLLLKLEWMAVAYIAHNRFGGGAIQIRGKDAGANTFSNHINVFDNVFIEYTGAAVSNTGEQWNVIGNAFENGRTALDKPVYAISSNQFCANLLVEGNWIGDGGKNKQIPFWLFGNGITIIGNKYGASIAADPVTYPGAVHTFVRLSGNSCGVVIKGNHVDGQVDCFVDFGSTVSSGIEIGPNVVDITGATPFQNMAGISNYRIENNVTKTGALIAGQSKSLYGVRAHSQVAQSIPDNVYTAIAFESESGTSDFDLGGYHPTGTGNDTFTVPAGLDGMHVVQAGVWLTGHATGQRYIEVLRNGSRVILDAEAAPTAGVPTAFQIQCTLRLSAGDTVQIRVNQNSGGPLNTIVAGQERVWCSIVRL